MKISDCRENGNEAWEYDREELTARLCQNAAALQGALESFFADKNDKGCLEIIKKAQCYSLLGGGKRIRPFLVNEVCRMLGGSEEASMPFAMAVEMIHTYSLIHDDLPCMDNDDMRRGKPSNHKAFGESTAVLAGDALLTNAFLAAASSTQLSSDAVRQAIMLIGHAAGDEGMIGGQIMDMDAETRQITLEELKELHALKTGRMIRLSAALGALAAGCDTQSREFMWVCSYADKIGLVFQMIDDLLDREGDATLMGKATLSDAENQKCTFLSFFSPEQILEEGRRISESAMQDIGHIKDSEILRSLAAYLLERRS